MAQVPGIKLHKSTKGKLTSVTISMKHHGDKLQPLLEQIGAVEEDDFDKRWREAQVNGYTVEELGERLYAHNRKLWNK